VFDSSIIALVSISCINVKDLVMNIRRAWNKSGEDIAVLKTISRIPHLSSLDLTLDASDYTLLLHSNDVNEVTNLTPSDPSFSAFDRYLLTACSSCLAHNCFVFSDRKL
jgi:hypothetical protein